MTLSFGDGGVRCAVCSRPFLSGVSSVRRISWAVSFGAVCVRCVDFRDHSDQLIRIRGLLRTLTSPNGAI